jgi:hypothetical protein
LAVSQHFAETLADLAPRSTEICTNVRIEHYHKVYILRLARLHVGPRYIVPGNQIASLMLVFELHLIHLSMGTTFPPSIKFKPY